MLWKKKWKGGLQVCKAKKWSTKKCCKGLCIAQIVVLVVWHLLQWHLFCREWEENYFCSDSCILSSFVYRAFYIVSSTEDCTVINYYNCCLWICYIFFVMIWKLMRSQNDTSHIRQSIICTSVFYLYCILKWNWKFKTK